jgi:hypothetical protein
MVKALEKVEGHAAEICYRRNRERLANALNGVFRRPCDWRKFRMGPAEALCELAWTLADTWECADLRGHLAAWWDVVSGTVEVD